MTERGDLGCRRSYMSDSARLDRYILMSRGAVAKLIAKEGKSATLRLPSGEVRLISKNCFAKQFGHVRPVVRGVVMNPVDHPHGGGEGRAPIGRKKTHNPLGLSCAWKKK
ncbi:hypothetical protein C4D60_Mb00t17820 [Musa balbisiana]|uniref:Large ribosomal subunit protein uL2 C-terminal domain-containing protein n=1 Tax=Musa balbisiana TaxID=52838 RepID=A0A4S8I468_MUSBA|nr:hypothetical protein C4D60_Mb00t17820 [Musa balbisiana]